MTTLDPDLDQKYLSMVRSITDMGSVLVAFSGGVDSTLVLKAALEALGPKAIAGTGLSGSYAAEEMAEAAAIAGELGAEHVVVETMELTDPRYADNSSQRCFFCKSELYSRLQQEADRRQIHVVVDGANMDDLSDFRPGMRAARDLGVRSPLQEAGLGKAQVRQLSKAFALRTWDKPAAACLSSRFAYGDPITVEKLRQVGAAETFLRSLGYRGFRVRHHQDLARLEFPEELMSEVLTRREEIVAGVRAAGYAYVTIDLEGFRSGRMNEVLNARLQQVGLRSSGPL